MRIYKNKTGSVFHCRSSIMQTSQYSPYANILSVIPGFDIIVAK